MSAPLSQIEGIEYFPDFFSPSESGKLFASLEKQLAWSEESIKMYGKPIKVPRLVCWYGDDNVSYRYSGIDHTGLPWTPELLAIKKNIEQHTNHNFNSVLGNYYRDGNDSMGWHADNEKELGKTPCIASVSLGEERLFKIRHKQSRATHEVTLCDGSLLIMSGNFQNEWQHSVPKTKTCTRPRINLTYRYIFARNQT